MANIICHHNGWYNLYTTIADGFCYEEPLSLADLEQIIKDEYGNSGLRELPARLERAHKYGTSSIHSDSIAELVVINRAGEHEAHLSVDECIERFFTPKQEDIKEP